MNEKLRQPESFSDAALRRYLLCLSDETERGNIEARLLADDALDERLRLAEYELADDYAAGRLSAAERGSFVQKFLVTAGRARKVAVSEALHEFTNPPKSVAPVITTSWRDKFAAFFSLRPSYGLALGLILLASFLAAWYATRQPAPPQIVRHAPTPTPVPATPAPKPAPQPTRTPAPVATPPATPKSTATPPPAPPPVTIASLALLPGALRDGGELARLTLPRGKNDIARLQLNLEDPQPGLYQVELLTAEGQNVAARRSQYRAGKLTVDFPARLLKANDYQIKLTRITADGNNENAGRFYFRVLP